jgi:exopolysaccharide production protein ExoZ
MTLESPLRLAAEDLVTVLSIQYLRAVAALLVMGFHIGFVFGWDWPPGAAGVDIFFVISGFVMWLVTTQRPTPPGQFLVQRITRIAPLYWVITLVLAAAAIAAPQQFPTVEPTIEHVVLSLLFVPHLSPSGGGDPLLVPGWTLNYEMFFYAVFAVALLLPRAVRLLGLTVALGTLVILGILLPMSGPVLRTYTSPLLLEFLAGAWLGWAWIEGRLPRRGVAQVLFVLGAAAIAGSQLVISLDLNRALIWGAPAVCIVGALAAIERHASLPEIPLLRLLGDASYSIYLSHLLTIVACKYVLSKLGIDWWGVPIYQAVVLYLLVALTAIAVGLGCYWALERPMTRFLRRVGPRRIARAEA